jgi:hypothetical protein
MAGLYEGIEDVAFKKVEGGYVFQTSNPWLIGSRRRYFVDERQKAAIAECIRETLRRIRPFALVAAIVIPAIILGGTLWLTSHDTMLRVTVTSAAGQSSASDLPMDRSGGGGEVAGEAGAKVLYHVSGPPGEGATITYTPVSAQGKAGAPVSVPFSTGGATLNVTDGHGRIVNSAVLRGHLGSTRGAIFLYAALLAAATFAPYLALMHVYQYGRLRPLIAGLPRTTERIRFAEQSRSFAGKASIKLLVIMGIGAMAACIGNGAAVVSAVLSHQPLVDSLGNGAALVLSGLAAAYFAYLIVLRRRLRWNAA